MWAMEHFRVLPTDPRLQELDDAQIALMFQFWIEYDESSIRKAAREELSRPRFDDSALRAMGYSAAEVAAIKRQMK